MRQLRSKEVHTYIDHRKTVQIITPSQYSDLEFECSDGAGVHFVMRNNINDQVTAWLKAREGCHHQFRTELLLKYIKFMNYQVVIRDIPSDAVRGKVSLGDPLC